MSSYDGSDDTPNPFGDFSDGLSQMFRMLGGSAGGPNWEQARNAAAAMTAQSEPDPNVDPLVRIQYEQLARVAELQVARVTGLPLTRSGAQLGVSPVNRGQFASSTVDDFRPLFEKLADSLGRMMSAQMDQMTGDDLSEMESLLPPGLNIDLPAIMAQASKFIGPMMLVTLAGSTAGQLGNRAFGSYDLPIPRPRRDEIFVVATSVDSFGEAWSLPLDDLRLTLCISEMAFHAVLSIPHISARLLELLSLHADGFEADPDALAQQFGDVDLSDPMAMAQLQSSMMSPEFMLNAIRSERQRDLLPLIDTLVSCIVGYVDWVLDTIATTMLTSHDRVSEAFRRRRVETDEASRFVERLFGMELTQEKCDRGTAFITGVVDRAGAEAFATLWESVENLPTPNELEAPGLWLARVGVDADQPLPELDESFEIPDFPDLDT